LKEAHEQLSDLRLIVKSIKHDNEKKKQRERETRKEAEETKTVRFEEVVEEIKVGDNEQHHIQSSIMRNNLNSNAFESKI